MKEIDNYYLQQSEPVKGCLLALRKIVLEQCPVLTEAWKYRMPFFCYHRKMFCYLWVQKGTGLPYLGIVEGRKILHPDLIIEKRSRMKIILFDPGKDLPKKKIQTILRMTLQLYKGTK